MDIICPKCSRFLDLSKVAVQHIIHDTLRTTSVTEKRVEVHTARLDRASDREYDVRLYYHCPRCLSVSVVNIIQAEIDPVTIHREGLVDE